MGGQLRLRLERAAEYGRGRFIVSASNIEAARAADRWPGAGQSGVLCLVGPEGSGKTHLSSVWAARTSARRLKPEDLEGEAVEWPSGALLLDDADQVSRGEAFFHLLNGAARPQCCLLMTGRTLPIVWASDVQDLRSRLNALPVVELGEPDDAVLRGVLINLFEERHIRPPEDLLAYLLKRIERSSSSARNVVAALDEASASEGRSVSRALARQLLMDESSEPNDKADGA